MHLNTTSPLSSPVYALDHPSFGATTVHHSLSHLGVRNSKLSNTIIQDAKGSENSPSRYFQLSRDPLSSTIAMEVTSETNSLCSALYTVAERICAAGASTCFALTGSLNLENRLLTLGVEEEKISHLAALILKRATPFMDNSNHLMTISLYGSDVQSVQVSITDTSTFAEKFLYLNNHPEYTVSQKALQPLIALGLSRTLAKEIVRDTPPLSPFSVLVDHTRKYATLRTASLQATYPLSVL